MKTILEGTSKECQRDSGCTQDKVLRSEQETESIGYPMQPSLINITIIKVNICLEASTKVIYALSYNPVSLLDPIMLVQ